MLSHNSIKPFLLPLLTISLAFPLGAQTLTLSDFSQSTFEAPGWQWQGFADTVMGGRSTLDQPRIESTTWGRALRLTGQVVTRGGGFIQVRLQHSNNRFDGTDFAGVEIEVQSPSTGSYYVFARTRDNTFPWSYYGAKFEPQATRTTIRIPWQDFLPESTLRRTIRPDRITSLALVAAYADFQADLSIFRIGLYR
jgi:hypothetical protein